MSGSRTWAHPSWLLAGAAAWLCLSSCSGRDFTSTPSTGGTTAAGTGVDAGGEPSSSNEGGSLAGGSTAGGAAGAAGQATGGAAGEPPAAGAGGTGDVTPPGCDCPAGQYCRDGSTDCFDCLELNRLRFTSPERLATVSDGGQGVRFPRIGVGATDLVYFAHGVGMRYTTDASTSAGGTLKGSIPQDSAPLLLSEAVGGFETTNIKSVDFVFDRVAEGTRRELYFGSWNNGLTGFERAPAPYNTGKGDYSMAVAEHPSGGGAARAFWMTTRDVSQKAALVTATTDASVAGAPVLLKVGAPSCAASDDDLTPWVSGDGKTLLFSHTRLDGACQAAGQGKDLYITLLEPSSGQPPATTAALPVSDVNSSLDDLDPSFSADMCELYFASNRDGQLAVYRAKRR